MTLSQSVCDVLWDHVVLESKCSDPAPPWCGLGFVQLVESIS
jgi:hypothetical protein